MHSVNGSYLIMDAEVPTAGVEDDDYEVVQIPNEDLTESALVSPYDELSSWDDIVGHDSDLELMKEASRPAVYLHTSGSTGTFDILETTKYLNSWIVEFQDILKQSPGRMTSSRLCLE